MIATADEDLELGRRAVAAAIALERGRQPHHVRIVPGELLQRASEHAVGLKPKDRASDFIDMDDGPGAVEHDEAVFDTLDDSRGLGTLAIKLGNARAVARLHPCYHRA